MVSELLRLLIMAVMQVLPAKRQLGKIRAFDIIYRLKLVLFAHYIQYMRSFVSLCYTIAVPPCTCSTALNCCAETGGS